MGRWYITDVKKMKHIFFVFVLGLLIPMCSNAQYTPLNIRSSSSNHTTRNSDNETLGYISAKVGMGGVWSFKFYSNGTFESHVWYGDGGKYSTKGKKRKESFSNGTYIIKKENGERVVYLRYANGNETKETLEYRNGRVVLLTDYSGYSWKRHEEFD